jgi:hypothetical protein
MNKITESFEEQWAEVAAMTGNCSFVTGRPVIHASGSMSTTKEGFFMRYGVSFLLILFGLAALTPLISEHGQESNNGSFVTFLLLLLAVLFLYTGIVRTLTIRRLCWNEGGSDIYLHYGWLWNRHILQIPRASVQIKMSVVGETKLFSHFYHGDTILLLELKNRSSAPPIRLLANSSRGLIRHIARQLAADHIDVEDLTLAEEIAPDGRPVRFPKTGIGRTFAQFPNMRLILQRKQGQIIVGRTLYQTMFWTAFVVLGFVVLVVGARLRHDLSICFIGIGALFILVIGVAGWFSDIGTTIIVDSEKAEVIIRHGFLKAGSKKKYISFRQIVGIQVCPYHINNENCCTGYELNLVIQRDTDVERINLLAEGDNEKVISYAQQIAAAMNKPIFDHTMIKKKTLADTIIL